MFHNKSIMSNIQDFEIGFPIEFGEALTEDLDIKKTLDNYREKRQNNHKNLVAICKSMPTSKYSDYLPTNWERRTQNLANCATFLQFKKETNLPTKQITDGKYKLYRGNFCKERFCPICAHNKSLRNFHVISEVTKRLREKLIEEKKILRLIFVTLTIQNCSGEDLHACIKLLNRAVKNLRRRRQFQNLDRYGGFKKLEVTFNEETWTFNAHLHLLIYTDEDYFHSEDYLHTEELSVIWTECVSTARRWFLSNSSHLEERIDNWREEVVGYAHRNNADWLLRELIQLEAPDDRFGSGYKIFQKEKLYSEFKERESEIAIPERKKMELTSLLEKGNNDVQIRHSIQRGYFFDFDDNQLVCFIEAVPKDESENAVAEVSKYVVKPGDCIPKESEEAQHVVFWLDKALFHQQTENFWGEALELEKIILAEEKESLEEDEEVAELFLQTYIWTKQNNYKRVYLK